MTEKINGKVLAVSSSATHSMQKQNRLFVHLKAGIGIEGDAHSGEKVKHRSRVAKDPDQPNLRQVHLIHSELHDELREKGFHLIPGQMGENITTSGIDLLSLPEGAVLHLGKDAVVRVTGLRNPCTQLDKIQAGLMQAVLDRDPENNLIRKAGIMGVVLTGGPVRPGDSIQVSMPGIPYSPLKPV